MKFTDGYWLYRKGYSALHPRDVSDVVAGDGTLTVYAPTKRIASRGDALNLPQLTVTFEAPMPDVIGVTIEHHQGGLDRGPHFGVNRTGAVPELSTADSDGTASITSGGLTARISTSGDWGVEFLGDGRLLTGSTARSVGVITDDAGRSFVHEQLSLGVGTNVYGLGERFGAFVKNGQSVDIWNEDGGTSSEQAYKNVPFYPHQRRLRRVREPPREGVLRGRLRGGVARDPVPRRGPAAAVLRDPRPHTQGHHPAVHGAHGPARQDRPPGPTGCGCRPRSPPTTTRRPSRPSSTGWPSATCRCPSSTSTASGCASSTGATSTGTRATFPDPEGMLARLHDTGLKVCVWINPYIAQRSPLFAEGLEQGYLVKRPDGSVWQWDLWQAGMGLVDFTNPDAVLWYQDKLRGLLGQGVDCFKTDFGERIPTDVVLA